MKKMVVHRKKERPKLHPWLFLAGSVIVAGGLVALAVYFVVGRETPEKKARRLTAELVESIGKLDWKDAREKMNVPDGVSAHEFESWMTEWHEISVDQAPVVTSEDIGDARLVEEGVYEVSYSIHFHFRRTDRKTSAEGVAGWRYDVKSDSMSYIINEATKGALDIR